MTVVTTAMFPTKVGFKSVENLLSQSLLLKILISANGKPKFFNKNQNVSLQWFFPQQLQFFLPNSDNSLVLEHCFVELLHVTAFSEKPKKSVRHG